MIAVAVVDLMIFDQADSKIFIKEKMIIEISSLQKNYINNSIRFIMKLGIVVTNYNNSDLTKVMVDSIRNYCGDDSEIVIVDNCSEEIEINKLKKIQYSFSKINCIFNEENKGYFRGLIDGIKYFNSKKEKYEAIIIGNNDLEFSPEFFINLEKSASYLNMHPVICPNIITLDGVRQNPHVTKPISKFRLFVWDLYYSNFLLSKIIGIFARTFRAFAGRGDEQAHLNEGLIYEGYGACYILTSRFFEEFDELWAPTFLMGEEFFLAKQIQQIGARPYYGPHIVVKHRDHASVSALPSRQFWEISRTSHQIYLEYAAKYGYHEA